MVLRCSHAGADQVVSLCLLQVCGALLTQRLHFVIINFECKFAIVTNTPH
jgi:hypothetical protein